MNEESKKERKQERKKEMDDKIYSLDDKTINFRKFDKMQYSMFITFLLLVFDVEQQIFKHSYFF